MAKPEREVKVEVIKAKSPEGKTVVLGVKYYLVRGVREKVKNGGVMINLKISEIVQFKAFLPNSPVTD
jgi:hypothetical protein